MKELLKLKVIGFCDLENSVSRAEYIMGEWYFQSDGNLSAHGVCAEWFEQQDFKMHLAWNGVVYPRFEFSTIRVEGGGLND